MTLKALIAKIIALFLNPLVIFLSALAVLLFLWGLFNFLRNADSEEARMIGKKHMINGLIGLLVMVSAYGIMSLITGTFNFKKPPTDIKINDPKSVEQPGKPYDFQKK